MFPFGMMSKCVYMLRGGQQEGANGSIRNGFIVFSPENQLVPLGVEGFFGWRKSMDFEYDVWKPVIDPRSHCFRPG